MRATAARIGRAVAPAGAAPVTVSPEAGQTAVPSLSLVVPAFNEADRISETIRQAAVFLAEQPYATELIVVDDGSTDETERRAREAAAASPIVRVIAIPHGGKAAALRAGMLAARGEQIGFSDADLATPLGFLNDLRAALAEGAAVAIGSRQAAGSRRIGEPIHRHLMGRAFNAIVRATLLPGIHDTQCGFKLFDRAAAHDILERAQLYRDRSEISGPRVTAFDVELLVIARRRGYAIRSIPVTWSYGEGSKVRPLHDSLQNLRDVAQVAANSWLGRYR
ncbi:MAG: glycosyltransferase [Thermomicrobiales bacterium]|nr:glycosyltransferase [Thermomicrobiales bacterium]